MTGVIVVVDSQLIGSASGPIHIVFFPSQVPASFARCSCILPGVPAITHAFTSSSVQPAGSFIFGSADAAFASFDGSAAANEPRAAPMPRAARSAGVRSFFERVMGDLLRV